MVLLFKGTDPLLQLSSNLAKTSTWHFLGIHMAVASVLVVRPEAQDSSLVLKIGNWELDGWFESVRA